MAVILTGGDGYVGWPTALRMASELDERVVAVDDLSRRRWVEECGSVSAVPVAPPGERTAAAKERYGNLSFVAGDLTDRDFVKSLMDIYEPSAVVHLAAQPSAPYSQINGERALDTQTGNVSMTLNLLWALREAGLENSHFVETTTMGVYGAPEFPVPEGEFEVEYRGGRDTIPYPAMAGSWYHMTKTMDAANMRLANRQWGQPCSDLRTAIVYGTETEETRGSDTLKTRFDFDYYFGTVVNRFCAQAVAGYPVTVYGKGEQRKPMISLEDTVQSTVNAVTAGAPGGVEVYNQATRPIAIVELADTIAEVGTEFDLDVEVKHFENPREEKEEHEMVVENDRFTKLLGEQRQDLEEGVRDVLGTLVRYGDALRGHEDRFLPGVLKGQS
ncbi:MAG: GDP-L-fucose synthase [Methanonatronarchaeales archaeon]|nr:GDP-L-fucose synthase [Methanonatronarchaeales archaeon]